MNKCRNRSRRRAHHAGDAETPFQSRARLYRKPERGKVMGVCAGIADYFGFNPWAVRLVAVISLFVFTLATLAIYFGLAWFLEPEPEGLYEDPKQEAFWRDVRAKPGGSIKDLSLRFKEIERRIRACEAYVTSKEFKLKRQIGDLEA